MMMMMMMMMTNIRFLPKLVATVNDTLCNMCCVERQRAVNHLAVKTASCTLGQPADAAPYLTLRVTVLPSRPSTVSLPTLVFTASSRSTSIHL